MPRRAPAGMAAAALEALTSGNQTAAAFFKGLDWYSKGQLNDAATQLQLAAGPRREFFPAAFYLGATFAAAGRDRDAAGIWQLAIGKEPRPAIYYILLADARLRDGQSESVIDVLKPAYERNPADDELGQRLASAYLMNGRYAEAMPVLDSYLTRHPNEQVALFAAVFAQYHVATRERLAVSAADQAKAAIDRFRAHLAVEHPGRTEPVPGEDETWDHRQVWAHVAEFGDYWLAELAALLDAPAEAPSPFGRTRRDAGRIAAIESGRDTEPAEHLRTIERSADRLAALLAGMTDADWERRGGHETLGVMDIDAQLRHFHVGHYEEHADQLDLTTRPR